MPDYRKEIAVWLVDTGFPFDWDTSKKAPEWLLDELALEWHRVDQAHDETIEDYKHMIQFESRAFR